jgi:hypothetical protein
MTGLPAYDPAAVPEWARELIAGIASHSPHDLPFHMGRVAEVEAAKLHPGKAPTTDEVLDVQRVMLGLPPLPPGPPDDPRGFLRYCAAIAWEALADGEPAPSLTPELLQRVLGEAFGGSSPVDQIAGECLDAARKHGVTIDGQDGEVLPGVLDLVNRTVAAAFWSGLTTGYFTITCGCLGGGGPFPDADLDREAGHLFTVAGWCRDAARAELTALGWAEWQEAAFMRSFEDLVDAWTTYKIILGYLPGADGKDGRPTREQVLADLEKPRRAFASALGAYNARLLDAAAHADRQRTPAAPGHGDAIPATRD